MAKENSEKLTEQEKKNSKHPVLYIFSVILLVVIAVTFIGGPVVDDAVSGGVSSISFGSYGKDEIEFAPGNYFSQQRELLGSQVKETEGANWKWEMYRVWRGAFERTAVHVGMLAEARDNGTYITSDRLNTYIIENGPYKTDGEFDVEVYENTPASQRESIRRDYKESALKEYYLSDYIYGNKTSEKEHEYTFGICNNERSVQLVFFPFDRIAADDVKKYAQSNGDLFRKISISKITLASESDAKKVLDMVRNAPENFADTAKAQSKDVFADNGGDMGSVFCYTLRAEIGEADADAVFALGAGQVSEIIASGSTYSIYKCNSPAVQANLTDSDVLSAVKSYISRYERGFVEDKAMAAAQKFSSDYAKDGIYAAAAAAGVSVYETEPFVVNYGALNYFKGIRLVQGELDLRSAMYSKDFFIQAFSVKGDKLSEPVILDNGVVVMKLLAESSPDASFAELVKAYGPQIDAQYAENDIAVHFLKSDKLKDNFQSTFDKYFVFEE